MEIEKIAKIHIDKEKKLTIILDQIVRERDMINEERE
jgi:hypothetical protein